MADFLENDPQTYTQGIAADLVNFGFETSLDILKEKQGLFTPDSLILAPLSSTKEGTKE